MTSNDYIYYNVTIERIMCIRISNPLVQNCNKSQKPPVDLFPMYAELQ
jgi:hypothetical protein